MDSTTLVDISLDLNLSSLTTTTTKRERSVPVTNYSSDLNLMISSHQHGVLVEELNRVSSENKRLTDMLINLCESYNALEKQYMDLKTKNLENELILATSKKRKAESDTTECSSSDEHSSKKSKEENMKPKVSKVYVRTVASDTSLGANDGYQWRKYGQKVTRDNPAPRAYYKCSFAPSCPVKKKVQRSAEDPSVLVATYEGEHNHSGSCKAEASLSCNSHGASSIVDHSVPVMRSTATTVPTITLDMMQPGSMVDNVEKSVQKPPVQPILIQQMASSLSRDPNFTAALAAAISGKFVNQFQTERW